VKTIQKISLVRIFAWILLLSSFAGCKHHYTPKPAGYLLIDLPEKAYQIYNSSCPYTFEYPLYGKIIPDTSRIAEPCWINIEFPQFAGKIHISYKPVNNNVNTYIEDCRTLAYKHTVKADAIKETLYTDDERKVYGLLYEIKGDAASNVQFYLTDSTRHFLRGALYFNVRPNADSLAPVIDFFREDIMHLIETLEWKNL
jgi:gliding motility-associated lipoprotein GldD